MSSSHISTTSPGGGWVGGGRTQTKLMQSHLQTKVGIEVEAELGEPNLTNLANLANLTNLATSRHARKLKFGTDTH